MENKPGIKTTEFWLIVLSNLAGGLATLSGQLEFPLFAQLAAILNSIYVVGRSIVKALQK